MKRALAPMLALLLCFSDVKIGIIVAKGSEAILDAYTADMLADLK